jgi:NAD(P)-dependent dehydrogenase (short-subunit alcohol dehydrogenase family)
VANRWLKLTTRPFQRMVDLSLNTTFCLLRAAIPVVRTAANGRIAISSKAAVDPGANVGAYSASKPAMVSLIGTLMLWKMQMPELRRI